MADLLGMPHGKDIKFFETSSEQNVGVSNAFHALADQIYARGPEVFNAHREDTIDLDGDREKRPDPQCCSLL